MCVCLSMRHLFEKKSDQASRLISTGGLKALQPLHLRPIDVVVSHEPLGAYAREILSWGGLRA